MQQIDQQTNLLRLGLTQMQEDRLLDAVSTFSKVIKLNPLSLYAFQYRALCKHTLALQDGTTLSQRLEYMQDVVLDLEIAKKLAIKMRDLILVNPQES